MIQRVRGTRDFSPNEMANRRLLEDMLRQISKDYGYREIQTPTLENSELFVVKSGPGVLDEMYSFEDKGGRQLALRPELTAPIIRFYIDDLTNYPLPLKLFCVSNCFRYEEPQAGRYREFYQYDVEIIGSETPESDAELLMLAADLCRRLGLKDVRFRVGHVGIIRSLLDVVSVGKDEQTEFLHLIDKKKIGEAESYLKSKNVKTEQAAEIMRVCGLKGDLSILEGMHGQAADYLKEVIETAEGITGSSLGVDLSVVRGLDYYTGVVFEIDAPELGAEKQVCGGGSYSLAPLFGGKFVPCTGMAFGFDRLLLAMEKSGELRQEESPDVFVLSVSPQQRTDMVKIAGTLRKKGIRTEFDLMRRTMSKSLKYVSSRGIPLAVIAGEKEISSGTLLLRDMNSGEQWTVKADEVSEEIRKRLGKLRE